MSVQLAIPLSEKKDPGRDDEKYLLQLIAEGDKKAFAVLFGRYENKVYSHALTFVKSPEEAEELVTDIFMKVWNRRIDLPCVENFKNYLFILGRNHLISAIRKKVMSLAEINSDSWQENTLRPDEQYDLKETNEIIMCGIEKLSPQQKKVFKMSRLEGLTYQEIAETLSISQRTVKFHIILALNHLREFARNHYLSRFLLFLFVFSHIFISWF